MAILPAGKGMVYAQQFGENLKSVSEGALFPVAELAKVNVPIITASVSEIHDLDASLLTKKIELNAELLGMMATDTKAAHLFGAPEPLYIRPPDITMPAA